MLVSARSEIGVQRNFGTDVARRVASFSSAAPAAAVNDRPLPVLFFAHGETILAWAHAGTVALTESLLY